MPCSDLTVEIITWKMERTGEVAAVLTTIHPHHHRRGLLAVATTRVVVRLSAIECGLMMIGKLRVSEAQDAFI
jgi:hypothetical protein